MHMQTQKSISSSSTYIKVANCAGHTGQNLFFFHSFFLKQNILEIFP